jgi:hypothetical protein
VDLRLGEERSENVEMVSSFYALDPRRGNAYQKLKYESDGQPALKKIIVFL